jgi:hypothetical protein
MRKILLISACLWSVAYGQNLPYKALAEAGQRITVNDTRTTLADSLKIATSRAMASDLANVYDGRGTNLNVYAKMVRGTTYTNSFMTRSVVNIKLAGFGDSMGDLVPIPIKERLQAQYGNGGGAYSTPSVTGGGSVHNNVSDNVYWPTGIWAEINGAGTLIYQSTGAGLPCNQIKIYYIIEPGAGTFQVALDSAGAGYVNEGSVVDANGTLGGGIITINKGYGNWSVRITRTTGNVKIIHVYGFAPDRDGVAYIPINNPGLNWANANTTSRAITSPVFTDMGIDWALLQFKENGNIYSSIKSFLKDFKTASPTTDWTLIGSPQNADIGGYTNAATVLDNASLRRISIEDTMAYYDGQRIFGTFQKIVNLGFAGDSIHLTPPVWQYIANHILRIEGVDDIPAGKAPVGQDIDESLMLLDGRRLKLKTRGLYYGGVGIGAAGMYFQSYSNINFADTANNIQAYFSNTGNGFMIQTNQSSNGYGWNTSGQPGYYYNGTDHQIMLNKGSNIRGNVQVATGKANAGFVVSGGFVGATNTSVGFEINSNAKAYLAARGSAAQRLALTAVNGMFGFHDNDSLRLFDYVNSGWKGVRYTNESAVSSYSRYTPTAAGITNVASVGTVNSAHVTRVGEGIKVEGSFSFTPTLAATTTVMTLTLPNGWQATNTFGEVEGQVVCNDLNTRMSGFVIALSATLVQLTFTCATTASNDVHYSFIFDKTN